MTRRLAIGAVLTATALLVQPPLQASGGRGSLAPAVTAGAAPVWSATDIDGRVWSSTGLRGRVVLVDFWATWCAPCLAELPRLQQLHRQYADRGLTIVGVSLDRSSTRDFRSWLQRQGIGWPQVREGFGYDGPLTRLFDVESLPAAFLFDTHGRLRAARRQGGSLAEDVRALMEGRR